MRRFALGIAVLVGLTAQAAANGRPPATSTIHFRHGHEQDIAVGMTFGLVLSHDGGATWQWMCEKAVHYGGMYDPVYEWSTSGKLFATTFDGYRVTSDGCNFDATTLAMGTPPTFTSAQAIGPNGDLFVAAADSTDVHVYKSTDDGATFPTMTAPGAATWWQDLKVAPSDPTRVYLTGYQLVAGNPKVFFLEKSVNGGTSFTPMTSTGFTTSDASTIEIAGISHTNPDLIFVRVTIETGNIGDGIYRSTNGGTTWTKVLAKQDSLNAFVVRTNGDLVAGTPTLGAFVSHDNGDNWLPLTNPPHLNCLVENAAGEVWGCTRNYGSMQVMADGFGIMKTTDLATWTPVMKYQDIAAPVSCAAGTFQHDECTVNVWCGLRDQLGIVANPTNCPALTSDTSGDVTAKSPKGCCAVGDDGAPVAVFLSAIVGVLLKRRRR